MNEVLRKFGIENDPDWVAVVLFVRNLLTKLSIYTYEKKVEIQREVTRELVKRDFSETHFNEIIAMLDMFIMQNIGTIELEEALTREKRSAAQLLNEMDEIIHSMHGTNERQQRRLDAFKEHTVGVIQSSKDRSVIVAKVREIFTELIVEFKQEAKELQEKAEMLERTANFDPLLTELHNRRALDAYLNQSVLEQGQGSSSLSMMMIDVDHFKRVNDTHGHQAGDDLLRALARILTAHAIQYQGFTARYGGEELALVVKNMDQAITSIKAEAIRAGVAGYDFRIRKDGKLSTQVKFTVSIGVAQWREGWDAGQLVSAADNALYEAKNAGRNKVCEYTGE